MSGFVQIDDFFKANEEAREKKLGPVGTGTILADLRKNPEGADYQRRLRARKKREAKMEDQVKTKKACKVEGCEEECVKGRGLCLEHNREEARKYYHKSKEKKAAEKAKTPATKKPAALKKTESVPYQEPEAKPPIVAPLGSYALVVDLLAGVEAVLEKAADLKEGDRALAIWGFLVGKGVL